MIELVWNDDGASSTLVILMDELLPKVSPPWLPTGSARQLDSKTAMR